MLPQKPNAPAGMYYVAHVLPAHLNERVLAMKEELYQLYGCKVGLKSPAHITLVPPFRLVSFKEQQLLSDVARLAAGSRPFVLHANNFAAFGTRTLFVAVQHSRQLERLKNAADAIFTGNAFYNLKRENRPFHPHITLATRDLATAQFKAAWALFGMRCFEEEWEAGAVSLLRHNGSSWDVLASMPFACDGEDNGPA